MFKLESSKLVGQISESALEGLREGITVDGFTYKPMHVTIIQKIFSSPSGGSLSDVDLDGNCNSAKLRVTLHEGKNREVRKILNSLGLSVENLKRVSYGPYSLGDLPPGQIQEVEIDPAFSEFTSPACRWTAGKTEPSSE